MPRQLFEERWHRFEPAARCEVPFERTRKKRRSAIESYVRDVPPTRALRRPTRPCAPDRSSFERHITTTFVRTTRSHAPTGASVFVARARRREALPRLSSFDRGAPFLFARSQTSGWRHPQLDTNWTPARVRTARTYITTTCSRVGPDAWPMGAMAVVGSVSCRYLSSSMVSSSVAVRVWSPRGVARRAMRLDATRRDACVRFSRAEWGAPSRHVAAREGD